MDIDETKITNDTKEENLSFDNIFELYGDFVYNISLKIIGNSHDAEEIVQDVFVSIYNKLKDFKFKSSLKTWIYRITVNHALNYAKKIAAGKNKKHNYRKDTETNQTKSNFCNDMEKKETKEHILQLFELLTPEQKTCLILRTQEDLSYKEIAKTVGISVNSVKSRIKRAREKLLAKRKDFENAM